MSINLSGHDFLKEVDFTPAEWLHLMDLSAELKAATKEGREERRLVGKNIALIFEKASTRTRISFEVAAHQQGAHVTYLNPEGSHLGHKESIGDTARVLARVFDGIEFRGAAHHNVEELAQFSDVPVWNGLTDSWHPTQSLCDGFTMVEASGKKPNELSFAFLGDGASNMGHSCLVLGAMLGADVRIVAPESRMPEWDVQEAAKKLAAETGAKITLTENVGKGVEGVDFIHTDVWVSMGEPKKSWYERAHMMRPYQVNARVMAASGNPDVKFMHCLPAFHDMNTKLAQEMREVTGLNNGFEVTHDVFESDASIVFDQSENRMHTIKAVMVATLAGA